MALTESEAKVLGALPISSGKARSVEELSRVTGVPETSIRRALMRLVRTGLAISPGRDPARWHSTDRGRLTICRPEYREYAAAGQ